jgi:DNA-binding transcriptional ArsR family regulator
MNDELLDILRACSSTEPATFSEFLRGLPDIPERGDKPAWSALFRKLDILERDGYIDVERDGNNRIETLRLTDAGISEVRGERPRRVIDNDWPDLVDG